jgi:hypothetical protein
MSGARGRWPLARWTLALVAGLALACRGDEAPIARLTVEPAFLHLAYPRWSDVDVRFELLDETARARAAKAPIVFVHLLNDQRDVVRTFDHPLPPLPPPSAAPATAAGGRIEYPLPLHQSALAAPLPPGEYRLTMGVVDADGTRWPLSGEVVARREYLVAKVDVPPADDVEPLFTFSNQFFANEAGSDVQHPAIRWFEGEARLRIAEVAGSGSVLIVLHIPAIDTRGYVLELEAGATEPSVFISSPCSETQTQRSGAGRHVVRLPLRSAPTGGACEIRLAPNFRLKPEEPGGLPRTAVIESLAWAAE